jgi:hypothetical protein
VVESELRVAEALGDALHRGAGAAHGWIRPGDGVGGGVANGVVADTRVCEGVSGLLQDGLGKEMRVELPVKYCTGGAVLLGLIQGQTFQLLSCVFASVELFPDAGAAYVCA